MSISSFTMVTMLDSRPSAITIPMPRTNDIPNRVITFKDIYGSAISNRITLVTQGGDVFEDNTFSTIMSNAFDTITFHAGLPGRWHRTAGTMMVGGTSASSTNTNSISTTSVYAKTFYGDGSQLTGVLTTGGTTTFSNIVAITSISNAGWLSNTGPVRFGGGLSNTGVLCNTGTATFGNTLGVTGILTPSGGIAGAAGISNTGLLSNTGLAYIGGTLGVTGAATFANTVGITNLLTTSAGISNTGLISTQTLNAGSMSTLQLTATSATVNTLNFYITGQSAFSTGTFRYSTLTMPTASTNTSVLLFNNLIVAGAYVWPGQLIKALGWEYALNGTASAVAGVGTTIANVQINNTFGASAATFTNYYVASNVTGGTPPYTFLDGDGTGVASNALSNFGLSISNNYTGFPQFFGLIAGTITNYGSQNLFKVRLTDSTWPIPMVRNISFTFNTFAE